MPLAPGIWNHKWRLFLFCLIVDYFGVEYVSGCHALHLKQVLTEHYKVTENWKGDLYSGINLQWNYHPAHTKKNVHLTMYNYISNLLIKFTHPNPKKPQHSPYKHTPILYGAKIQYAAGEYNSPPP